MSFIIRAALAIGVLSYLAAHRIDPALTERTSLPTVERLASAALGSLPLEARDRVLGEGAGVLAHRMAGVSHDTLAEADRRPAWRGSELP